MNAVYQDGHHGNAVVSRHPIAGGRTSTSRHHPLESRGLLHCEVQVDGWKEPVHCINVHLGLVGAEPALPARMALASASRAAGAEEGTRSSWPATSTTGTAARATTSRTSSASIEVFERAEGARARSYPAQMPFFTLDRIYVRDLDVEHVKRHVGAPVVAPFGPRGARRAADALALSPGHRGRVRHAPQARALPAVPAGRQREQAPREAPHRVLGQYRRGAPRPRTKPNAQGLTMPAPKPMTERIA
jgi:hypothetical protein